MKIKSVNAYQENGFVTVNVTVETPGTVTEALEQVVAALTIPALRVTATNANGGPVDQPQAIGEDKPTTAEAPATRTRRTRATPADTTTTPAAEAASTEPPSRDAAPAAEASTRRRRAVTETTATVEEPKPTISDVDLSKAASNAATIVGQDIVLVVLKDFGVAYVGEIKGEDERARFLKEINEEILLHELDKAGQA